MADALVFIGLLVMTIAVAEVQRMRDIHIRLHAASKAMFLGIIALVVASVATRDPAMVSRGILIAAFLLITTPVSAHAIARAAHARNERAADSHPTDP